MEVFFVIVLPMQACRSPTHTIAMSSKLMKYPTSHRKRVVLTRPYPLNGVWGFQFFNDFLFKSIRISQRIWWFSIFNFARFDVFWGNILQGQKSIHFQRTKLPLRDGGDLALEARHCLLWRGQWWLWSQGSLNGHPFWGIKLDANMLNFREFFFLYNGVLFGLVIIMISVLWVVDRLSWFTLKFNGFFSQNH